MTENWLNDNLCSFDEKVRIERGPQIIELDCTDENLADEVTHPQYKIGGRDALGRAIRADECDTPTDTRMGVVGKGEKMACVDWRAKHVPHLWKIYQMQETDELDDDGKPISRFIKVAEKEGKDDAIAFAKQLIDGYLLA